MCEKKSCSEIARQNKSALQRVSIMTPRSHVSVALPLQPARPPSSRHRGRAEYGASDAGPAAAMMTSRR